MVYSSSAYALLAALILVLAFAIWRGLAEHRRRTDKIDLRKKRSRR